MASNFINSQVNCDGQRDKENHESQRNKEDGCLWSDEEIKLLIEWYGEYQSDLRRAGRNSGVYRQIAHQINATTHAKIHKTERDVSNKIISLRKQYALRPHIIEKLKNFIHVEVIIALQDSLKDVDAERISVSAVPELSGNQQRIICTVSPEDVSILNDCNFDSSNFLLVDSLSPDRVSVQDGTVEMVNNVTSTPIAKKRRISGNLDIINRNVLIDKGKKFMALLEDDPVLTQFTTDHLKNLLCLDSSSDESIHLSHIYTINSNSSVDSESIANMSSTCEVERLNESFNNLNNGCERMFDSSNVSFNISSISSGDSSTHSDASSESLDDTDLLHQLHFFTSNSHGRSVWVKPQCHDWYDNIFPTLDDRDFREQFRVKKETFNYLINILREQLEKRDTSFRKCIPIRKRIAISLFHLSSCGEFRVTAQLFGIGKGTACKIVHSFIEAVISFKQKFIVFPSTEEQLKKCADDFNDLHGLPQCVGTLDGCHIPVCPPKEHAVDYYNYKGYYSIILFAVVDARYCFIYINVGAPGRNNDAEVLRSSNLWERLNSDFFDSIAKEVNGLMTPAYFLGDAAFPLMKNLLKPYADFRELNEVQKYYNHKICGVRRLVENAFGRVKARFRRIYKRMEGKSTFFSKTVECCCILHNICEHMRDEFQESWHEQMIQDDLVVRPAHSRSTTNAAKRFRDNFANAMFQNRPTD